MKYLLMVLAGFLVTVSALAESEVTVYKSPTCGCCKKWISHLEDNGFRVKAVDMNSVMPIKRQYGIGNSTASCHTALIDGYVIEGHVPASDIKRLLKDKPGHIRGLAVPGMPVGSPGMEQGARKDPYAVLSIDKTGRTEVYSRH